MSSLVQTEHQKVTYFKDISPAAKVLSATTTVAGGFFAAAGFTSGMPEMGFLWASLVAGNNALTGYWVKKYLTGHIQGYGVYGDFKSSVFALWGKDKTYPVYTLGPNDTKIPAELCIGRGSAFVIETKPVEPLDLWDSSMAAVRNVYSIHRASYQNRQSLTSAKYSPSDSGSSDYFYDYSRDDYDDYYLELNEYTRQLKEIETYEDSIARMQSNPNCPQAVLKAKQNKLKEIKAKTAA